MTDVAYERGRGIAVGILLFLAIIWVTLVFIYRGLAPLHDRLHRWTISWEESAYIEMKRSLDESEKGALNMYQYESKECLKSSKKRLKSMIKEHVTVAMLKSSANKF